MKQRLMVLIFALFAAFSASVSAQPEPAAPQELDAPPQIEYVKGVVESVTPLDNTRTKFISSVERVEIKLLSGENKGQTVTAIHYRTGESPYDIVVKPGDQVIVSATDDHGVRSYHIADFARTGYLYILAGIFLVSLVVVGGKTGIKSIVVLVSSLLLIFKFFVPEVLAARINLPVLAVGVCSVITVFTLGMIGGLNRKTAAAVLGTMGGTVLAGFLAALSIQLMHLSGLASEEAIMLKVSLQSKVNFQGLLFTSMMIGALGAIMDVTMSIASATQEIKLAQPKMGFWELFKTGMNVGRDVMGTMSDTLILAYTGSSLPLMLLLAAQENMPILKVANLDLIVTEITRALSGSIGLVFAIPFTAAIASFLLRHPMQEVSPPATHKPMGKSR